MLIKDSGKRRSVPIAATGARASLQARGCLGPVRILSPSGCRAFLRAANSVHVPPLDWNKGCAATSRAYYEIGTHPRIMDILSAVLGEDIILWGASIQERPPNAVHAWHTDIESSAPSGKFVSVWIGLENTCRESSLQLVPYSHRFGVTVQELRHRSGIRREDLDERTLARWAKERDARARPMEADVADGEALFFDGRLWHGSRNSSRKTRRALLLQYAAPDMAVRIPDLNVLDWPFRTIELPRPPCIVVSGDSDDSVNRIVSAPVAAAGPDPQLSSRFYALPLPLALPEKMDWKPFPLFRGATANLRRISCHVSALREGCIPHEPHTHDDEELLIVLSGEAELLSGNGRNAGRRKLKPGQFVFYPAGYAHTLRAAGGGTANYLMFKWRNGANRAHPAGPPRKFQVFDSFTPGKIVDGFKPHILFEHPTRALKKLHCHMTTLTPGAGYASHADAHDVAIVLLEGQVETMGRRVTPPAALYYVAGEPHGMRNCGDAVARYIVFEFHG